MKKQIRVTTVPTSGENVGASKSLISNDETTVPTVPTYSGLYEGGGKGYRSGEVSGNGGFGGYGGYSNFLQVRTQRPLGVNDGGHVVGQDHHRAKLTDHEVWLIRELREEGMTYPEIAAKFDISKGMAHDLCSGRRRSHLATGQRVRVAR